jgi:type I restriction enzyme S subunit
VADFLDRETAEIDAFIADQEELIGLLVERRAATISHAVTKGLDPNVPMKDSGVEWLGEVPAAWDVLRIKHVGYSIIGLTYSPDDIVDEPDNSTIVLRSGNVQNGRIDISSDVVRVLMPIDAALRTREGDIVICARNGSRALVGKNALIEKQLVGQTFGAFMSVLRTPDYRFVQWILNSSLFASQMGLFSTSTVNQLTKATLDNFEIPWPDSDARLRLAIHLDRETAEIDAAIADAGEAIALSRERRAALISAAVTGKIDVREHGAVA